MLAALELHPDRSSLGYPFPWDAELLGRACLARTLEAILACPSIDRAVVVVPAEVAGFAERVSSALDAALPARDRVTVFAATGRDPSRRERVARLRRLAPDSWRAGWAIPHAVAERGDPLRLLAAAEAAGVEELLLFPPAATFVCADLVEDLLRGRSSSRDALLRLSTLPPGVSADLVTAKYLRNVVAQDLELDEPVRFLPDRPERDLDTKGAFHWYPRERSVRARLTAESRRGAAVLERVAEWLEGEGLGADPASLADGRWLERLASDREPAAVFRGPVPAELALRVTDRLRGESIFDTPLESVSGATDVDSELVERIASELASWQEARLVIRGGEPMLHPRIDEILRSVRAAEIGCVVLETDALDLGERELDLIAETVDAVVVPVDAVRAETFRCIRGIDRLGDVERAVDALLERGADGGSVVAVEFREVEENVAEAEAFLDRWFPRTPWVVLDRFRDHAGQLARRPLHAHRLSSRRACARITDRLVVHPDGTAAVCDNDFDLQRPAGDLAVSTIAEVWSGERLTSLRELHAAGRWSDEPLCASCDDWCRRS